MKKVLVAFDGQHFSDAVFEFVKQMNEKYPVMAVGMFLPSIDYIELLYSFAGVPAGPLYITEAVQGDDLALERNIARFKELCLANNVKHEVHRDFTKHIVNHVRDESRFADILVLSSHSFYENLGEDTQEDYISNVLHGSECPVVLIPTEYKRPESIVIAYDGSEQSVFALKQFTYLFPEFHDTPALLVYFDTGKAGVPERQGIEDLASLYFEKLTITKLKISPKKDLEQWIGDNGDTLLVAGAYGRSLLSETFKRSFVADIIRDHKISIFVAHK